MLDGALSQDPATRIAGLIMLNELIVRPEAMNLDRDMARVLAASAVMPDSGSSIPLPRTAEHTAGTTLLATLKSLEKR